MKINYKPTREEIRALAKEYNAESVIYTKDGFEFIGVDDNKKAEIKSKL